jgi:hypothetical protein
LDKEEEERGVKRKLKKCANQGVERGVERTEKRELRDIDNMSYS